MDDSSAEEARVLGQILAAQNMLCVFLSERRLAEFVKAALRDLPGVGRAGVCLRLLAEPEADLGLQECKDCAGSGRGLDDIGRFRGKCKLEKQDGFAVFPLNTAARSYGYLLVATEGDGSFERYRPFVVNFANSVAVALENRLQQKRLSDHISELERVNEQLRKEIAERRRGEEALRKSQEQLLHAEKLSALGKLVSSIVHEFSSPVHGVRGVLEQVHEEASLSESIKGLTKLGIKECNRMSEMIQKLRGFYRPSAGIAVLLDLNALIDDMIFLSKKKFQSRKIQTVKNYAPDLPRVSGVEDQLKQVVLNLLQNAEESIPDGGGEIVVTTEATDTAVRLIVQDTGTGIPPDALPFIFDPFFTTKPGARGTGLGLPVSHGIVKKHRGDIEVKSRFGEGTTFIVTLPR
ncbi:MAG: hypothetical protein HZA02_06305 [Nitrospinae bacterium]|nr:hypothetical protein [Nitrospinota bacterium]